MMRALTVYRPVDEPMALGIKPIENRPKPPPRSLLGEYIAIHAGKIWDEDMASFCTKAGYVNQLDLRESHARRMHVVGVARVVGWQDQRIRHVGGAMELGGRCTAFQGWHFHVEQIHNSPWWLGPVGILLTDAFPIDPVPCRGMQGYWPLPPDVETMVRKRAPHLPPWSPRFDSRTG